VTKGRCLCGAVRYEYDGEPMLVVHCHCDSCRRQTSSSIATFVLVKAEQTRFSGVEPAVYESSPGVRRRFCPRCGSPIDYQTDARPGIVDLYAGTLEAPEALEVRGHVRVGEQLPWFEVLDDLPRWETVPKDGRPIRRGPRPSRADSPG
jgi:hypothetical protein